MKVDFRHKSLKALHALEPTNSKRLEDRIYKHILVGAQEFTQENAGEHQEGIELLGQLFMIHQKFQAEAGMFEDMFGEYMEGAFKLNNATSQFFTTMPIVRMMVKMTFPDEDVKAPEPQRICDPAAGTGRFMLGVAEHYAETNGGCLNFLIVNIDVDHRAFVYCCMNAILNRIPAICIWGNSLSVEVFDAFVIGIPGLQPWFRLEKDRAKELIVSALESSNQARKDQLETKKTEEKQLEPEPVPAPVKEPFKVGALDLSGVAPAPKKSVQVGFDRW